MCAFLPVMLCVLQGLTLALSCLSYDFVGTCADDSSEDMTTIQVGTVLIHFCSHRTLPGFDICWTSAALQLLTSAMPKIDVNIRDNF